MDICERLRQLREVKNLSQGDIEQRTGLLRCYISRVENGHTVPSLETLEKISRALEVPMYQLFIAPDDTAGGQQKLSSTDNHDWASVGKGHRTFYKFRNALARMSERDRAVLLYTAAKMVATKRRRK